MSYRWVTRAVAEPFHGGSVLAAIEALHTSRKAMGLRAAQQEPFILIVMPGLFMTLDSMERCLGGILEHNNRGKILLVSGVKKTNVFAVELQLICSRLDTTSSAMCGGPS